MIAFTSERDAINGDENSEIYVMQSDGSSQTRLTNNNTTDLSWETFVNQEKLFGEC